MATVTYPKGGRKPGKTTAGHTERLGDPYRFRAELGQSDEAQFRRRANNYSKSGDTAEPVRNGQMVSPMRTMIRL